MHSAPSAGGDGASLLESRSGPEHYEKPVDFQCVRCESGVPSVPQLSAVGGAVEGASRSKRCRDPPIFVNALHLLGAPETHRHSLFNLTDRAITGDVEVPVHVCELAGVLNG